MVTISCGGLGGVVKGRREHTDTIALKYKGGQKSGMDLKGVAVSVRLQGMKITNGPTSSAEAGDDEVEIG